jgi:hypothetical protein
MKAPRGRNGSQPPCRGPNQVALTIHAQRHWLLSHIVAAPEERHLGKVIFKEGVLRDRELLGLRGFLVRFVRLAELSTYRFVPANCKDTSVDHCMGVFVTH